MSNTAWRSDPTPIAVTAGEPAGIGPDLVVRLAQVRLAGEIVAVADPDLLLQRAALLALPLRVIPFEPRGAVPPKGRRVPGELRVLRVPLRVPAACGHLNPANAAYVLETLERAGRGCLEGAFAALVTAPVHKGLINDAGIPFSGHTEYLAALTGSVEPVMMLCAPGLRVALCTTHVPPREVSGLISEARVTSVLRVLVRDLRERFGVQAPRIIVCGLNPHAGEGGHLGREEAEHIAPAIATLRALGHDVEGPVPADTAFIASRLAGVDAVLAMYHDQGLPVLKHHGFGAAVNVTLGLPILRTSVDHGTALDKAGTADVDPGSMLAATHTALDLARRAWAGGLESARPAVPA
ncbi:MAG: 4-hydroxythreonine-4-phosphate dehydrogenase PdxA [Gammaproteobacteria bacterium]